MQCATLKRSRCSSLENINVEQQQQSLFDVSIIKLQHEQLRHGVEPRLLRFVLINNALRCLQGHMLHIESEDALMEVTGEVRCESSDLFFYNTFKNGSLSPLPIIPPTPVKMMKLDSSLANQSPLVEYQESSCSSQDVLTSPPGEDRVHPAVCFEGVSCEVETEEEEEVDGLEGGAEGKERRMFNGFGDAHSASLHLGKRSSRGWSHEDEAEGEGGGGSSREHFRGRLTESKDGGVVGISGEGFGGSDVKKPCKPPSLIINCTVQKVQNGLNSLGCLNNFLDLDPFPSLPFPSSPPSPSPPSPLSPSSLQQTPHYHHANHYASPSEDSCDKESLTPSPIDFTNVDPTLYDFDTAVLQVGTTDSVPALDANHHPETSSLPSVTMTPVTSAVVSPNDTSSQVTLTSTTTAVVSPLVTATPSSSSSIHFLHTSAATVSTEMPPSQQQQNGGEDARSEVHLSPYLETEKLSLLSADSHVSTYPPGGSGLVSKGGSCSMKALVRAQNGCDLLGEDDDDCSHENGGSLGNTNGRSLPTSPEHGTETDCVDEIEHIVKLLMT